MRRTLWVACALACCGCAADKPADHPIVRMAQFDLNCPKEQLHYVHITEKTWGVRGCGRQTKYVEVCHSTNNPWGLPSEDCQWVQN